MLSGRPSRPAELVVVGQVEAAEAALAQQPLDAVAADVRRQRRFGRGAGRLLPLGDGAQGVGRLAHGGLGPGGGTRDRLMITDRTAGCQAPAGARILGWWWDQLQASGE
jgi:hypothetical protein